jgi:hypothetical protein
MGKTGTICAVAGTYRSSCACATTVALRNGQRKPPCPTCGRTVEWSLVLPRRRAQARDIDDRPSDAGPSAR